MSESYFMFRGVPVEHARVNAGPFVGLPAMTALTGLSSAFCLQLAQALGRSPEEVVPRGVLFALERYHLHEGLKRTPKPGSNKPKEAEADPASWASFVGHFAFRCSGATPQAQELLAQPTTSTLAQEVMQGLRLAKGAFRRVPTAVDLARYQRAGVSAELAVLRALPSHCLVAVDYSYEVFEMRSGQMDMMATLLAATLQHDKRPAPYRAFFEERGFENVCFVPVQNGFVKLADGPAKGACLDLYGRVPPTMIASPSYTLVRLQKAASVRARIVQHGEAPGVFWQQYASDFGFFSLSRGLAETFSEHGFLSI